MIPTLREWRVHKSHMTAISATWNIKFLSKKGYQGLGRRHLPQAHCWRFGPGSRCYWEGMNSWGTKSICASTCWWILVIVGFWGCSQREWSLRMGLESIFCSKSPVQPVFRSSDPRCASCHEVLSPHLGCQSNGAGLPQTKPQSPNELSLLQTIYLGYFVTVAETQLIQSLR